MSLRGRYNNSGRYNDAYRSRQNPLDPTLVGWWPLDESSGLSARDLTANNNDGTLEGDPTWVDTAMGRALELDGIDDIVNCAAGVSIGHPMTMAAWVRFEDTNVFPIVATNDSTDVYYGQNMAIGGTQKVSMKFGDGGGNASTDRRSITGADVLSINTWYHIVGVIRGAGDMDIYINGVDDASSDYSGTGGAVSNAGGVASIGGSVYGNPDQYGKGQSRDVRIYNRALSQSEVTRLYNEGVAEFNLDFGQVGRWLLNETSGLFAADSSVNSNTGDLEGNPVWVDTAMGRALELDGTGDYVGIDDDVALDISSVITIATWLRWTNNHTATAGVVSKDDLGTGDGYGMYVTSAEYVRVNIRIGATWEEVIYSVALDDGAWHSAVATYDGTNMKLYIDGVLRDTNAASGSISTNNRQLQIGRQEAPQYFTGQSRDVRIYNRALSQSEVTRLYNDELYSGTPDMAFTASGNGTLTPKITFGSGTCYVYVNKGRATSLTSGVSGSISVLENDIIDYVLSDWSSVTSIIMEADPIAGDVSAWILPSGLVDLFLNSTSVSGDISVWTLPSTLSRLFFNTSNVSGDIGSGWAIPASLTRMTGYSTSVSGDVSGWSFGTSQTIISMSATSLSGDISAWTLPSTMQNIYMDSTSIDYDSTEGSLTGITGAMTNIWLHNNALTSTQVDNILVDCDAAGVSGTATINVSGTNAAPSATGLTAKTNLEGRGYTVVVTP